MLQRYVLCVSIALFLSLLICPYVEAANAKVTNLSLTTNSKNLVLSLKIKDAFTRKIEKAILSGIPTTFTFFVEVYKVRRFWRDKKVRTLRFRHTVRYDNLKDEYEIILEENNNKKMKTRRMDRVKDVMTRVEGLETATLSSFVDNEPYVIRIKAELKTIRLPFPLKYVLFFVSFWDFETDWHTQVFSVKNGNVVFQR